MIIENIHKNKPLIHCMTNYVSMNDCANIVLACGAAPIMAEDINEVEQITNICDGLVINIGMLSERKLKAMIAAGKKANECKHPVVFDPVGAGASDFRKKAASTLINEVKFDVIRGNVSEIKAISSGTQTLMGVEANVSDKVNETNIEETIAFVKAFSKKTGAIIALTGGIDIVADSNVAYIIRNGHPMMSKVTGTGCQLSALTAAFICANPDKKLEATAMAVSAMGIAGEIAYSRLENLDGNATYRNYIIDAIYNMDDKQLNTMKKLEV